MTTKKVFLEDLSMIPDNANTYVYDVLKNNNYSQDTIIHIDDKGGLHITYPWVIASNRLQPNEPYEKKVMCKQCKVFIRNDAWKSHSKSKRHEANQR